jgi:hypothetical protein
VSGLCRCGCRRPAGRRQELADSCYQRWLYQGRPEVLSPPRWTRGHGDREARIEDYAELLSMGESPDMAARRVGVTSRTRQRYEAELRTGAA